MRPGRLILLMMAMVIAIAVMAVGFAWSTTTQETHSVSLGFLSLGFTGVTCSDPQDPLDPADALDLGVVPPKDVGWTECIPVDTDNDLDYDVLEINVYNAYPGYQALAQGIIISNLGEVPIGISGAALVHNDDPVALVLEGFWTRTNLTCVIIDPGEDVVGEFWVYLNVTQPALQDHTYTFQIEITGDQWNQTCVTEDLGGTPGFWKNWDNHNSYTQQEIETWLGTIDTASAWLGPTTTGGMESWLDFSNKDPMEERFLGQYLATRLDAASGRLILGNVHNVSALDAGNYLGLADPTAATLSEIITAIEAKAGTSPTDDELEVMKNVCDALNNLLV